jgi:HPt (histidine-containing phosphotransfer) domain-containing protein
MSSDRERCLSAGMDDYLSKPIRSDALRSVLEKFAPYSTTHSPSTWKSGDALANLEGDRGLMAELAGIFCQESAGQLTRLRDSVAACDCPAVERIAHTLKGSVSVFGAASARAAAEKLEFAAQRQDTREIGADVHELEKELVALVGSLQGFTAEHVH